MGDSWNCPLALTFSSTPFLTGTFISLGCVLFWMNEVLTIILLTLAPFLELRASIPYGILKAGLSPFLVVPVAIAANVALAPLLYLFFNYIVHLFLRFERFNHLWQWLVVRTQKKVHPAIEKYGVWGLAVFIGVPLPGSGVYTAALGAYVLGYEFKEFLIASILGVVIAAAAVTLITLFGEGAWLWFIKT